MADRPLVHLAIIMDGNGRWAERRGLERVEGHKAGAERVVDLIRNLNKTEIRYVTLYAFSTENWNRSEEEVSALMDLLCSFLDEYGQELMENRIRLLMSGRRDRVPEKCSAKIDEIVKKTSEDYDKTIIIAFNYGGRQEITDAARLIAEKVKNGAISAEDITEKTIAEHLYHPEIPDPDLLVRTSGEQRISNFLLWELSYAEFYFTDVLWPDFGLNELQEAIKTYENRDRRFGGRK